MTTPAGQVKSNNGTATFALVMSLLGLIPFIGLLPAIFGLIFGAISWHQTNRSGQQGRGMAIAATAISIFTFALWAFIVFVAIVGSNDT